jgi:hypothetical protein
VIRYTIITVLLLLAAFVVQQFLPAFTAFHHSRILLVQLVFLCAAVIGGFLWDAHSVLIHSAGDPAVYANPVESLRFGCSILLFGAMGFLMQGIQPLFKQGNWQVSVFLTGIAIYFYLAAEYSLISFVRGGFIINPPTLLQMVYTSLLTMLFSPFVFWFLFRAARACQHAIDPEARRKRRMSQPLTRF